MPNLTAAEVTNWYLYGQATTPTDLTSDSIIRPQIAPQDRIQLPQDVASYLSTGAGRFAVGSRFDLVDKFFTKNIFGSYSNDLAPGEYTKAQLADIFGLGPFYGLKFAQYEVDDGAGDLGERTYIWNNVAFK